MCDYGEFRSQCLLLEKTLLSECCAGRGTQPQCAGADRRLDYDTVSDILKTDLNSPRGHLDSG